MFSTSVYKGGGRFRPDFVNEFNQPVPYAFTRGRIMSKRQREWPYKTSQAKKYRALQGRKSAVAPSVVFVKPGVTRTGGYYGRYAGPNAELKFFDTANSFNIDATGEVPSTGQLCLIPQGITESTRVGRKCVIKRINIKWRLSFEPGAGATPQGLSYIYLVLDKQANGAAASIGDVFELDDLPVSFLNLANSQRFSILKKWVHAWNPTAGVSTAWTRMNRAVNWSKKCNIPLEFSSTTGAITEIRSNNIFLMAGCNTGMDDLVQVTGTVRLRYSDN